MHIVLVDPSRTVVKYVTRMLEIRQHEVHAFADGPQALDYIRSCPGVAAVIASAELITMTGTELCWEARLIADSCRPLYIILMSSIDDHRRIVEALDSGADDFIGKPPVAEELYARLRAAERVEAIQRQLIHLATTDPLTGLLNRRAFLARAVDVIARADITVSLVMFDIDHFKKVNDVHGHGVGDEVLREVSREAASGCTIIGRLGGEEFALLLEGQTRPQAAETAEDLRVRMAALQFDAGLTVSGSFGVAERIAGDTIDDLLKRADVALYAAKAAGRDRVVIADAALLGAMPQPTNSIVRARSRPVPAGAIAAATKAAFD
jgi:diguanylate cyclase (GGDEF)-like protein